MDFDLTEEQVLLKNSVDRLIDAECTFEQRQARLRTEPGWSREVWRRFAELGLLALPFDPEHGGLGGGSVDMMPVLEAFGRGLVLEPFLATIVLAGGALRLGAQPALLERLVPQIAEGTLLLAYAHGELQSRYRLADVTTTARRDGEAWVLDGEKTMALSGDAADKLIVSGRLAGDQRDPDGLALFLVDVKSPGVERRSYRLHDGTGAADIRLVGAHAEAVVGEIGKALPIIEQVNQFGIAAVAAEAVGIMAALLDLTLEHLKTREQFGGPIGRFQALQHRAADMLVALEQARSMAMLAALMIDDPDPAARRKALSAVKVQINRSARFIGQQSIQLHGGIGVTLEYKVGHYFKRLSMIESAFGDTDHHLAVLAREGGFIEANIR